MYRNENRDDDGYRDDGDGVMGGDDTNKRWVRWEWVQK